MSYCTFERGQEAFQSPCALRFRHFRQSLPVRPKSSCRGACHWQSVSALQGAGGKTGQRNGLPVQYQSLPVNLVHYAFNHGL